MSVKNTQTKSIKLDSDKKCIHINQLLLIKISKILSIVIEENKKLDNYQEKLSFQRNMSFTSICEPSLSIHDYLFQIQYYTQVEDNSLIMALIYIDRISEISSVIITPYNVHRILFVAILLAIKFNEDLCYKFSFYAKVAGISVLELKKLEIDFIILIRFKLYIKNDDFERYKQYLEQIN